MRNVPGYMSQLSHKYNRIKLIKKRKLTFLQREEFLYFSINISFKEVLIEN